MRFYALVLWRVHGRVPRMLQLLYLGNGEVLRYEPDEADLLATERKVEALWQAIQRATDAGDWRPSTSKPLRLVLLEGQPVPRLGRHASPAAGHGPPGGPRRRPGGAVPARFRRRRRLSGSSTQIDERGSCQRRLTGMSDAPLTTDLSADDPAVGLRAVVALRRLADRVEAVHVAHARRRGWSWDQVGDALGISKQAAHKKFGG